MKSLTGWNPVNRSQRLSNNETETRSEVPRRNRVRNRNPPECEACEMKPVISAEQYAIERAICDKAQEYWKNNATYSKSGWSSLPAELAAHPDYTACDNAMRGRVEQYEILRDLPDVILAYIGEPRGNGIGLSYPVTVWTGLEIGTATRGAKWRVNSCIGTHMAQFYARIGGREYTGRGFGAGMCIKLRETAESKRSRHAAR